MTVKFYIGERVRDEIKQFFCFGGDIFLLLFICHKTHIIMKYTCKNYKNRQDNKAFKLHFE